MKNFKEWELTYKVVIANPINSNMPITMIREALDACLQKLVLPTKVAIGTSSLEGVTTDE